MLGSCPYLLCSSSVAEKGPLSTSVLLQEGGLTQLCACLRRGTTC